VTYLREQAELPLGTAGSLALFRAAHPDLAVPTLVMNGDLMFRFEPDRLVSFHERTGAMVTVATRPYQHEVPFGVIETDGSEVTGIREKPRLSMSVNTGIYAVSPEALDLVEPGVPSTMPDLIQTCLDKGGRVSAWPLRSDWIDVGTPSDLARAKGLT
jgi:NDP-sugar pyrophosphorylase family protein